MADKIVGIDLGTTFSAVAEVRTGHPAILPNGPERIVPSVAGLSPEGKLLVGTPARNQYILYPENTVRSIKRKMGSDETVSLGGRSYTPAEISAIILREMKRIAELDLGQEVTRAVITVPAYFADAARQATKDAGEIAGLTVERIINEPTAAALAYGLERIRDRQMVAVYDLGGGTFDVSIIELNEGITEVRASHGNTQLGGDDFDQRLMERLAERFQEQHGLDPRQDRRALARLMRAAEQAKIELSFKPFAHVREEYLLEKDGKPLHLDLEVSREEFEGLILDLLEQTLDDLDRAVQDAGISRSDLDRVLFVGGSTRIPLVWEMVANHSGIEPQVEINPDEAVALGAAVQAAIIAGEPLEAILVDVTPHTLGIEVAQFRLGQVVGDRYAPIIHRNTTIPTSLARQFWAMHPEQQAVEISAYQGEAPIASQNTLLGQFRVEGLTAEAPGRLPSITVQFDLDLNGILHVSAQDRGSGRKGSITVRAGHEKLDPAARAAAAEHVAALEPGIAGDGEVSALLSRAQQILASRRQGLDHLEGLVRRIESTSGEGHEGERKQLAEELLDELYALEE